MPHSKELLERLLAAATGIPTSRNNLVELCYEAHAALQRQNETLGSIQRLLGESTAAPLGTGDTGTTEPRRRLMYAVGIEHDTHSYGMQHGPFPTREEALAIDMWDERAVILRFSPSGEEDVRYRWRDERWCKETK